MTILSRILFCAVVSFLHRLELSQNSTYRYKYKHTQPYNYVSKDIIIDKYTAHTLLQTFGLDRSWSTHLGPIRVPGWSHWWRWPLHHGILWWGHLFHPGSCLQWLLGSQIHSPLPCECTNKSTYTIQCELKKKKKKRDSILNLSIFKRKIMILLSVDDNISYFSFI